MQGVTSLFIAWAALLLASANQADQESKIISFPLQYDLQGKSYIGHIDLGKKNVQKDFKVIFDTGSSTTWLFGENCEKCLTSQPTKQVRQCEGNSCANYKDGQLKSISYGTGNVIGFEAVDYLSVLESALGSATKVPLSILLLIEADTYLHRQNFEGIVGLSFPAEESIGFLRSLVNSKIISKEQFSIHLSRDNPRIIFGGVEQNLFHSNATMKFYPIDEDQRFWKIPINSFSLDSQHSLLSEKKLSQSTSNDSLKQQVNISESISSLDIIDDDDKMMAHIDSGSNVLMVDVATAELFRDTMKDQYSTPCAIFSENGMNRIKCQCKNKRISDFPTLSFKFGDSDEEEYVIEPQNYVFRDGGVSTMCNTLVYVSEDETSKNEVLLGLPFFQSHYLNFNAETRSIGILRNSQLMSTDISNQSSVLMYLLIALTTAMISFFAATQVIKKLNKS